MHTRRRADTDTPATAEVVRLIGQTRRVLWITAARALASRGESVVAWSLVSRLAELGPLTQRELAEASAQHPAGVSRQLDDLERKGLTARALDPTDRRRRRVGLTASGRRWYRKLLPVIHAETAPVLGALRADERRMLAALLRRVLEIPRPRPVPGRQRRIRGDIP
jgi:DNA-binding MarR family transcriptional regulator